MRKPIALSLLCLALAAALPVHAIPPTSDAFTTLLHETFTAYRAWGRVDDELRWAPWLCRMPLASQARVSAAEPGTPHAQKVFFIYARDRDGYLRATRDQGAAPEGEVVVKESFSPQTLSGAAHPFLIPSTHAPEEIGPNGAEREFRALQRDGHNVGPGEFHGLYVLARLNHRWTYGTLDATGTITAAGQIASCIGCHDDAPHDHLFGLDAQ